MTPPRVLFYADLVGHDLSRWLWVRARAELAYGSWLLRQRRHRQAQHVLRAVPGAFDRIGVTTWASAARLELRAAAGP
jgi:hypothetical protein